MQDATVYLEMNFLKSEITVQKLNEKKNDYTKASVEVTVALLKAVCVHVSRRLRGDISETCDLLLCCHVTSCLGFGPDLFSNRHTP